jgi:hypothetical protein
MFELILGSVGLLMIILALIGLGKWLVHLIIVDSAYLAHLERERRRYMEEVEVDRILAQARGLPMEVKLGKGHGTGQPSAVDRDRGGDGSGIIPLGRRGEGPGTPGEPGGNPVA